MTENKVPCKRKVVYIHKDFQFKFILKFCLLLLCGGVISTLLLFWFSGGTLTSSFENSRLVIENTRQAILPSVLATNLITLVIICFAAMGVILYISHRIAGPMFRFEKDLRQIGQGDLRVLIHLRKKDQFPELSAAINHMTREIHKKVTAINAELEDILRLPDSDVSTCREKIAELKHRVDKEFIL